jgi:hypothetical protein
VRTRLVVEWEKPVEGSEPLAVLVVGLEEPLDFPLRLRSSSYVEGVLNPMVVEKRFEVMIGMGALV